MRLLSFLNLVENHLGVRQPAHSAGWNRRVNYHAGTACFSHPLLGLTLMLRGSLLADGQHNLNASWHGVTGEVVSTRSFFSGAAGFQWDAAAETVTDLMPSPVLSARAPAAPIEETASPQSITA
jgi:hypothetical protein